MHNTKWQIFWGNGGIKRSAEYYPNNEKVRRGFDVVEEEDCSRKAVLDTHEAVLELDKYPWSIDRYRAKRQFNKHVKSCRPKPYGCPIGYYKIMGKCIPKRA